MTHVRTVPWSGVLATVCAVPHSAVAVCRDAARRRLALLDSRRPVAGFARARAYSVCRSTRVRAMRVKHATSNPTCL